MVTFSPILPPALPPLPVAPPLFTIITSGKGWSSTRQYQGESGMLYALLRHVRRLAEDQGVRVSGQGMCGPNLHGHCYAWHDIDGEWAVFLIDHDDGRAAELSPARQAAWLRRVRVRALAHNRHNRAAQVPVPDAPPNPARLFY